MTSRALLGQKDCGEIAAGVLSWALAVRTDLVPKPTAAAVAAVEVINVLRSIFGLTHQWFSTERDAASSIRAATSFGLET